MPEEQLTEQVAHARCLLPPTLSLLLCVACPCKLCGDTLQCTHGVYSTPGRLSVSPEWSLVGTFRRCRWDALMSMQIASLDNLFGGHRRKDARNDLWTRCRGAWPDEATWSASLARELTESQTFGMTTCKSRLLATRDGKALHQASKMV